jgi:hypothetical protein
MSEAQDLLKSFESLVMELRPQSVIEVVGHKWSLRVTSAEDDAISHEAVSSYSKLAYLFALKIEVLARAIVAVDGVEVPKFVPQKGNKDLPIEKVMFLRSHLSQLPQELIDLMYAKYNQLVEEVGKKIDPTNITRVAGMNKTEVDLVARAQAKDALENGLAQGVLDNEGTTSPEAKDK